MRSVIAITLVALALAGPAYARVLAQAPAPGPAPGKGPGSWTASNTAASTIPGLPGQYNPAFDGKLGWTDTSTAQSLALVKNGAKFIDVRYKDEYDAAHLPGSFNIEVTGRDPVTLKGGVVNKDFIAQVEKAIPDKNTPIVITCWGGGLSRIGSNLLLAAGYKNISNHYYGFSNHNLWPRFVEDPWGDLKDANPANLESKFNPVKNQYVLGLAKTLGVFPDGLPTDVTTFIPSDEYLNWVAQLFGFPANASATLADYVKFFETNETAAGLLRHALVAGVVPKKLTAADLKTIGLTGVDTAVPGLSLKFNVSGTRVATPAYQHANIFGLTNGNPNSFIIDYPLFTVDGITWANPTEAVDTASAVKLAQRAKPLTAAEAQKLVSDAVAKAKSAASPASAPAKAPASAPSAGR